MVRWDLVATMYSPGTSNPRLRTVFGEAPTVDRFPALRAALRGSGGIAQGDDICLECHAHRRSQSVGLP